MHKPHHAGDEFGPTTARGQVGSSEAPRIRITVVVRTRNDAASVRPLKARLDSALAGGSAEIIFVDDSDDSTPEVVQECAALGAAHLAVRLIHRPPGQRAGDHRTAVGMGLAAARGEWVVVMDGDLRHPPELIPRLVEAGDASGSAVVVASRHAPGVPEEYSGGSRLAGVDATTAFAKIMFPYVLRSISDPTSDFFAVRRCDIDGATLGSGRSPILVEILVRRPHIKRKEVWYADQERVAGESKATLAESLLYMRNLSRISLGRRSTH